MYELSIWVTTSHITECHYKGSLSNMPKDSGKAVADVDCRPAGSVGLFNRFTVIILVIIALFVAVLCIMFLVAYNQLDNTSKSNRFQEAMKILSIIGLIVALVVFMFCVYALVAPDGTFKQYIKPQLTTSQIGVTKLNRA